MKRAHVTGIGVVAPNGFGLEEYWSATLEGRGGIRPLDRFDTSDYSSGLAGQVVFTAEDHLPSRLLPQTDVSTRMALIAAEEALADAKGATAERADYDMGVVTANASGGFEFTHREFHKLWTQGSTSVSVYESFAWFYAVNTGQISIRHAMRGPSSALVADQAGGLDAIGHARRTIARGTPLVVTGGVDSAFDPWGWVSHLSSGQVSEAADPNRAYLPFDAHASGYVPGEGGALLVLEQDGDEGVGDRSHGVVAGYASTFDPPPGSGRPLGLRRAIDLALRDARLSPDDVDVVFADGSGVPERDRAEADALQDVFGPLGVPVTVPKTLHGRLLSGGGPLDVATALFAIRDGVIPATHNVREVPDEYGVDLVRGVPREAGVGTALILARGRWGFNSAVVVTSA
ncbi:ketosynthase chain-length factor [Nocardiopsis nanhaiensis]